VRGWATYFDLHAKQSLLLVGIIILQLLDLGGTLFEATPPLSFDGLCSGSLCQRVLDVCLSGNVSSLVVGEGSQLLAVSFEVNLLVERFKCEL
jgi:hypothetical protein